MNYDIHELGDLIILLFVSGLGAFAIGVSMIIDAIRALAGPGDAKETK